MSVTVGISQTEPLLGLQSPGTDRQEANGQCERRFCKPGMKSHEALHQESILLGWPLRAQRYRSTYRHLTASARNPAP
ncbi:MAG TPA: hypothetical protein VGM03_21540 [Phycisphaerae bacterium]|jgi:hypothetical protein